MAKKSVKCIAKENRSRKLNVIHTIGTKFMLNFDVFADNKIIHSRFHIELYVV